MKFAIWFYVYNDGYERVEPNDQQRAILERFGAFNEVERYMRTERWGGSAGTPYVESPPVPILITKIEEMTQPDGSVEIKYRRERNPEYVAWFSDFLAHGEDHEVTETKVVGNVTYVGDYRRRVSAERDVICVEFATLDALAEFCLAMRSYEISFEDRTIAVNG